MRSKTHKVIPLAVACFAAARLLRMFYRITIVIWLFTTPAYAQRIQFPSTTPGLRPIDSNASGQAGSVMVPINPATQSGIYPSSGPGSPTFDPYSVGPSYPNVVAPPSGYPSTGSVFSGTLPQGGYPNYTGLPPSLPGSGQSATVGTFPSTPPGYNQPGIYPNSVPSALYPGSSYNSGNASSPFDSVFSGIFGNSYSGFGGSMGGPGYPGGQTWQQPNYPYGNPNAWNPQGAVFGGSSYPEFIRLFQGPRFRHSYIHGNDAADSLMINDSDLSLALAFPNFFYSTQPLYLLPSFSLHQWAGPREPNTADLPPLAYSAFLDSGWQSDPARILGAELGLRVGMFSDFETATTDSLRIQGRGIGRLRVTPTATIKGGVIYLDRNKVKLLPAGGLLWQPNPDTRFDLFFPEPKLAHYLTTIGTADTWWYVGGYYGGGSWTVTRDSGVKDSIDINDIRLALGIEWGRSDQMRQGRRVGFFEVGYVFDRELLYKYSPADNVDLQDTFMLRAGIGY